MLAHRCVINRHFINCDNFSYTSQSKHLANLETAHIVADKPREDSATTLKDSYFELNFTVSHEPGASAQYGDDHYIRLVNLGLIAPLSWIEVAEKIRISWQC